MKYVEVTTDESIEILRKSKGKKILVAIQDLENDNEDVVFCQKLKSDCEIIIQEAQTISSMCDDFVKKLDVFTEQQDLINIQPIGIQGTILLNG